MNGLSELVYQLPVAGLLLVVVGIFMRFIKDRDAEWLKTVRERDDRFLNAVSEQNDRTEEIQKEMITTLRHVAVNEDRTVQVLTRLEKRLEEDETLRSYRRETQNAG